LLALHENPGVHNQTVKSIADMCGDWCAAHVKSRQEKKFARECERGIKGDPDRKIQYFLPMIRHRREYAGKRQDVFIPLFPSYVFLCCDERTKSDAIDSGRICQIIPAIDQLGLLADLLNIERAIASDFMIDLYPFAVVGRKVRVRSGPLEGMTGTVLHRKSETRIVFQVGMLGVGASLEIDAAQLEPYGD
jgi:transcription antitermination factor NusG